MKQLFKALLPSSLLKKGQQIKGLLRDKRNETRSAREVFSEIYKHGGWGGKGCSGSGSVTDTITEPYIKTISNYLQSIAPNKTIVDLGCGDMRVSSHLLRYCSKYIGVDVVPFLIEQQKYTNLGRDRVRFQCLDIAEDELPDGDICMLRQVLQHLSNKQIEKVLNKIQKYEICLVTEHYPSDNPNIIPNKDMVHGGKIRLYQNSGVYLEEPPFSIWGDCVQLMLEVPGVGMAQGFDQGLIRTYRIEFKRLDESQ